ncbi:hypothetical protein ABZX99_36475 [Streptomyces antibioticus]|uniref:hypothetical protein n=1 Tax=Streptomyces antibioticus TaxID=1890 RepID=UPI000AC2BA24
MDLVFRAPSAAHIAGAFEVSKRLLHDHAVVSIGARRPDGTLYSMGEVPAQVGWAREPREVTPGRRPVMEIAGIAPRLIGWQSTRRQQIEDALSVL